MKWLWNFLAFIFAAIFISAITTHVLISSINEGYEQAKLNVKTEAATFANTGLQTTYSQMTPDQVAAINVIKSLTVEQRKAMLMDQCKDPQVKTNPYCDSRFLEGKMELDDILKENIKTQFEAAMLQALDEVKTQLGFFTKYPLILISIVAAVLSIIFYMITHNLIKGTQMFAGNISWLSFLSAVSFKFMPNVLQKLISQQAVPAGAEGITEVMKKIVLSWMNPAINQAFMFSVYLTIISFVIWISIKLLRKYEFISN